VILLSSVWAATVVPNVIVWAVELLWVVVTVKAVPPDAEMTVTDVVGRVPAGSPVHPVSIWLAGGAAVVFAVHLMPVVPPILNVGRIWSALSAPGAPFVAVIDHVGAVAVVDETVIERQPGDNATGGFAVVAAP